MSWNEKRRTDSPSLKTSKVSDIKINSKCHEEKLIHRSNPIGFKSVFRLTLNLVFGEVLTEDLDSLGRQESWFGIHNVA